ncbi:MAG: hypothetical protein NVS9B12_09710 [Vulcanimicrobiaceae bacterium]
MPGTSAASPSSASRSRRYRLEAVSPIISLAAGAPVPGPAILEEISLSSARLISKSMRLRGTNLHFNRAVAQGTPLLLHATIFGVDYKQQSRMFVYSLKFRLLPGEEAGIAAFIAQQGGAPPHQAIAHAPEKPNPLRAVRPRAYRVRRVFPVRFCVDGSRASEKAAVVDTNVHGMRIAFDRKLDLKRELDLQFTLPSDVLESHSRQHKPPAFSEMKVRARLMPQMQEAAGKFLYVVNFIATNRSAEQELERFVRAAQLCELNKNLASQNGAKLA